MSGLNKDIDNLTPHEVIELGENFTGEVEVRAAEGGIMTYVFENNLIQSVSYSHPGWVNKADLKMGGMGPLQV